MTGSESPPSSGMPSRLRNRPFGRRSKCSGSPAAVPSSVSASCRASPAGRHDEPHHAAARGGDRRRLDRAGARRTRWAACGLRARAAGDRPPPAAEHAPRRGAHRPSRRMSAAVRRKLRRQRRGRPELEVLELEPRRDRAAAEHRVALGLRRLPHSRGHDRLRRQPVEPHLPAPSRYSRSAPPS